MNIYILCPANRVTGGVELAHQLCYAINSLTDIKAFMWYSDIDDLTTETLVMNISAPDDYAVYKTQCATSFFEMDTSDNVIVVPEGLTNRISLIDNARIVLWWMSVDNYVSASKEENLDEIRNKVSLHLYQSYYSLDYVENKIPGAQGMFLSDYINEDHGKFLMPADFRKNFALYNPKKGLERIKPLIEKSSWLEWIPLINMSREKMIVTMQMSKIYVDFGNHPGKDRIPREAAANGCCVITNMLGSAKYFEDVSIPSEYKFQDPANSLDEIDLLLHGICDDFKKHQDDFEQYRAIIKSEKPKFDEDVIKFVDIMKNSNLS